MNAIFCRKGLISDGMCESDDKWTTASDFGRDSVKDALWVGDNGLDWNEIEVYTRRTHPVKPYEKYVTMK